MSVSSRRRRGRPGTVLLLSAAVVAGAGMTALVVPMASAADCSDVNVVVARGTNEPGRLGAIVGDPVFDALTDAAADATLSSTAVDYPASLARNSPAEGNRALVEHVTSQAASCPDQRFVLVGYSQGANVVGNSIGVSSDGALVGSKIVATIPAEVQPRVAAVLLFGYPLRARGGSVEGEFADRTLDICANGDPVCGGGARVSAHLSYRRDAAEAAAFAAGKL